MSQLPLVAGVIDTLVAATAPVESVLPWADTQSPTARLEALPLDRWVKLVEEFTVTWMVWVLGAVVGVVELLVDADRLAKFRAENENPDTVIVGPLTAVTLPEAIPKLASLAGSEPVGPLAVGPLPVGALAGSDPLGRRTGPPPPKPPPNAPPLPNAVQLPDEEAGVMDTVWAVMVPFDVVPLALMQDPTVTANSVTFLVAVHDVDEVQLTVSWPLC